MKVLMSMVLFAGSAVADVALADTCLAPTGGPTHEACQQAESSNDEIVMLQRTLLQGAHNIALKESTVQAPTGMPASCPEGTHSHGSTCACDNSEEETTDGSNCGSNGGNGGNGG